MKVFENLWILIDSAQYQNKAIENLLICQIQNDAVFSEVIGQLFKRDNVTELDA